MPVRPAWAWPILHLCFSHTARQAVCSQPGAYMWLIQALLLHYGLILLPLPPVYYATQAAHHEALSGCYGLCGARPCMCAWALTWLPTLPSLSCAEWWTLSPGSTHLGSSRMCWSTTRSTITLIWKPTGSPTLSSTNGKTEAWCWRFYEGALPKRLANHRFLTTWFLNGRPCTEPEGFCPCFPWNFLRTLTILLLNHCALGNSEKQFVVALGNCCLLVLETL